MALLLLRNRKASALGIPRILRDNVEPFGLNSEKIIGAFASVDVIIRSYCSGSGMKKFDFTDLTRPHTWYPLARKKVRKVILHVGPTNSGKTHQALSRLESSSSGIYCGPLRLLAWEVAKRLNKANVSCDLITGQEREEVDGAKHRAVTVEMADVVSDYDSAVPLIQQILQVTGDDVKVQSYERLSPLVPLNVPLGSFSNIQTGDCIVTFSRHAIYRLKKAIESRGKHLCSIVYGSLPPETRTRQATRFNDASSEFDVLVASDAIGMGLNLNISRIIFSTMKKFDGVELRDLTVPEVKQIAGRAGRYGSKFPVGEVTCLDSEDLPLLHKSLLEPSPMLEEHFLENAKLSENYFFANCEEVLKVATVIDQLPLRLHEKYLFCISPVDMNDDISSQGLTQFATNYSKKGIVQLREIFTPGTLQVPKTQAALRELESIHKVLDLYVWLSFRLEESFPDRELAASQKAICSMLIEEFLERLGWQKPRVKKVTPRPKLNSAVVSRC
ncbi:DExH-box ATP-dependent RNA helicase DExH16 [Citrus sinensis]|uniref:DExH-box ATP-dependent RNA helicase DExH16 n=1 Tax=Citrus sinensis TaxID=2711 RepID=A0ACB8I687_CITSI|nr:DExH-box ATP-dependent RNA helicase DExH16 [Citrus sinensis]